MSKESADNLKLKIKNDYGMIVSSNDLEELLLQYVKQLISNIIHNGYQVATACKVKTITIGHLTTVSSIQLKSIGEFPNADKHNKNNKQGGGLVHSSEYFGKDSGVYDAEFKSYDMFSDLDGGYSMHGLKNTGGFIGGGMVANKSVSFFIDDKIFAKYVKEIRGTLGNIKISADAMDIIRLSVELNIDMLMRFLNKKRFKSIDAEKVSKHVLMNKRRFAHFLKN